MIPWAKTKRTLDSRAPLWTSVTCAGIKTEYQEAIALLDSLPKRRAGFIDPMDCAPVSKLPDCPQWLFEIKLDGYRAVAVKSDRGVNLFSRRHKSFNHQYQHLVEALGELPEGTVVDGEVVALDESGRPSTTR